MTSNRKTENQGPWEPSAVDPEKSIDIEVGHGGIGKFNLVVYAAIIAICLYYLFAFISPPGA